MKALALALAILVAACEHSSDMAPYADIEAAYHARLDALTEAVKSGRMTMTEAEAAAAEAEAQANTAIQMRHSARRASQPVGPIICNPVGYSTICF